MKIAAFVFVLLTSFASSTSAETWTVNSTRDRVDMTPGDGVCYTGFPADDGSPECTLRAAVHEANSRRFAIPRGNTIVLPAGVFRLTLAPDPMEEQDQFTGFVPIDQAVRSGDLDIDNYMGFTGAGEGATIIEAGGIDRVFDVWSHYAHVVGFMNLTIRSGATAGPGGCIYHRGGGATVRLTSVTVEACISRDQVGGGMYNAGHTEMSRVTFRGNTALRGAGLENGSLAFIYDSTFDDNATTPAPFNPSMGGGIANLNVHGAGARLVIRGSTISNNASEIGGGILNRDSLTLVNSTVSGNRSGRGAGIAFLDAPAPGASGDESTSIGYSTIANNLGVGILNRSGGRLSVSHAILAGNGGTAANPNCDGRLTSSEHSLESGRDCLLAGAGDIGGVDPLLGPLANNGGGTLTHALLAGSPAIDAGRRSAYEPRDQRGLPRPLGAATDIGAFEYGIDPGSLMTLIPIPWEWLFGSELDGTFEFLVRFSLSLPAGTKRDAAHIVGVKMADGQKLVTYKLGKQGRTLRLQGIAAPPKPGGQKGAPLFYLEVQRSLERKLKLDVVKASCECEAKPAKTKPIVIAPAKPGGK